MAHEQRIHQLLEQLAEAGRTPEDVCRDDPGLLTEVKERWQQMRMVQAEVESLFPTPRADEDARERRHQRLMWTDAGAQLPRIPGYQIESVLGGGGMGVVYKARHLKLNRPVAIKMLLAGSFASPEELACLVREAQSVAALRHPHIVQVYDVGEFDGLPYFTMEFAEGGTLAAKLGGVPQSPREAASLVATLADGVEAAHRGGIVHRDLKPANILLTSEGSPKIADFSLARSFGEESAITLSSARIGTPSYMAPEQALGKAAAFCPSVDIYALGALLYELLTGRPFRAESPVETQRQVVHEDPAPPSRLNSRVPKDLETICLKCLSKDPRHRYDTAAALSQDLHRFLNGEPIAARPLSPLGRAVKWARRRPAHASMLALAVLILCALLGAGAWIGSQRAAASRAVREDLALVVQLETKSQWAEARNTLERAKSRLGAGSPDLRRNLADAERDLNLVDRLAAIRLDRAASLQARFDRDRFWNQYLEAFQSAGLTTGENEPPDSFAARVAASARAALVGAMDDWATCATDKEKLTKLLVATRVADPDPAWRDRARDYRVWLSTDALRELAKSADVRREPVPLMLIIGDLLEEQGDDARDFFRKIQAAHPDDFWANFELAETLDKRADPEAIGYYRAALAIHPRAVAALVNLGIALGHQGREAEAAAYWQQAVDVQPDAALAHYNLAVTAFNHAQFDECIARCRETLRIQPQSGSAYGLLGKALFAQAKYTDAKPELERAIELTPEDSPFQPPLALLLERCDHLAAVELRLPGLLKGAQKPDDPQDAVEIAELLVHKDLYTAAVAFYADAFAKDPSLAEDHAFNYRYNAACAAALAGTQRDTGPAETNAAALEEHRAQAIRWLRADLAEWTTLLEHGSEEERQLTRKTLSHWRSDPDLAGLSTESAILALPARLRDDCQALWAEYDAVVTRVHDPN